MGSDFLGVFGVIGAFAGAYMRQIAGTRGERTLGVMAIAAGVFVLVASVSRGPLLGLLFGIASLAMASRDKTPRRGRLATALGLTVAAAVALYAMQGLWEARLNASSTSTFDRPATWVSGARIATDNLLTGVGPTHVAEVVLSSPRYSETPYGAT